MRVIGLIYGQSEVSGTSHLPFLLQCLLTVPLAKGSTSSFA